MSSNQRCRKRILYNEQCLYIRAWLHREFWPFILCFIASSSCSFSYISLVFASLQQVEVGRYAGGNQVWSIKALTKWDRKMQADCRAKIIQNKRLHVDSKIQIKTNTAFFFFLSLETKFQIIYTESFRQTTVKLEQDFKVRHLWKAKY